MQTIDSVAIDPPRVERLRSYYAVAAPLIERHFAGIPFTWSTLPAGVDGPVLYHGPLAGRTRPKAPVVDVATPSGVHRYPKLSAERILGLVEHGAVEVLSWTPVPGDPSRARFGRILLSARGGADPALLLDGCAQIETELRQTGLQSLRVYDGGSGAAIWIPFADGPAYECVRTFLHGLCLRLAQRAPATFTLEPNSHGGPPLHLHVQSNAVGRFSILPFSARASRGFPVAIPMPQRDAATPFVDRSVTIDSFESWLNGAGNGDAFARRDAAFWAQTFPAVSPKPANAVFAAVKSHGPIVSAAIEVLQDGRSRDAGTILALALERRLLDASVTRKYVYTSLIEYIARANGNGRKPAFVQNADHSFRLNEPPDDWPGLDDEPSPAPPSKAVQALIDRLSSTAEAGDPAAFEAAVCDAFDALGFAAVHVGGQKAPDGYADALLGPRGYRITIECKSAGEGVNDPGVFEASKFRDSYRARYCALVGRAFSGEIEVVKELHNHGVSAWTIDDLQTLLRIAAGALEIEPLFTPGFAAEALDDLLWERRHGRAKRVRIVAESILRAGWATQASYAGQAGDAPRLTEDALMLLVDQDLAAQGSRAACSRDDVRAALDYLANPLVAAIERDPSDGSAVVTRHAAGCLYPPPATKLR
ncbi:MAG TPA: hypothetical protein VMF61_01035 [Candidatus Acidoferrales bacterium]|nr:hypothetical protein [Candidatus Acidoferrales bacterium]